LSGVGCSTFLAQSRFTLPLQALTPLETDDGTAYLMLLNPTGGVLGGDHLATEIIQEPCTHVCLATPSATRVYRTAGRPAVLETVIKLGEGSTLEYLLTMSSPTRMQRCANRLPWKMGPGSAAIHPGFAGVRPGSLTASRWGFSGGLYSRMEAFISWQAGVPQSDKNSTRAQQTRNRPDGKFDYMICMGLFAEGRNAGSKWPPR